MWFGDSDNQSGSLFYYGHPVKETCDDHYGEAVMFQRNKIHDHDVLHVRQKIDIFICMIVKLGDKYDIYMKPSLCHQAGKLTSMISRDYDINTKYLFIDNQICTLWKIFEFKHIKPYWRFMDMLEVKFSTNGKTSMTITGYVTGIDSEHITVSSAGLANPWSIPLKDIAKIERDPYKFATRNSRDLVEERWRNLRKALSERPIKLKVQ